MLRIWSQYLPSMGAVVFKNRLRAVLSFTPSEFAMLTVPRLLVGIVICVLLLGAIVIHEILSQD